ncbi:protein-export membrane protein SecF [Candidatus Nomurabacteria bacterium RIFOXYC2_FULL_36_19]|uniref:Protein-export membrane protein SecF n=3 Tax=Candidatus Nomuraibacteriota TaxID=1752729 RepID=A0A1F6YW61_9BACT|nr:MAG: protein-export membrane protein SecF [Candidatus Nomurabacteria bacterium RIFOXYA2_FULL_35_9]OGJ06660.1 MAG: protein-export membrane protein SecF [Candidatus Nomurabacteria bacterium RIFOXYA1_FULL_35_17]OGJ10624.1 MAG: protein-export membrane protein SecF [Candidatus Nomurabacteria bacterium RIFOXYC2_FULL_36_19]OGJ13591.1 MAG: protein-export membrane protein SecF [Candidatus Nomurabacteria bacterium RIFOXYD2_FULL_35_12]
MMFITKYKKIFLSLSIILVVVSIVFIFIFGLKPGIDFKGGALMEVSYANSRPEASLIEASIKKINISQALIQPTGEFGYLIKTRDLNETEHQALLKALLLDNKNSVSEKSFTSIGPSVGSELTRKAIVSITMVILAIILFITYAFRHVSRPVASWKYGVITIVTLLHDIIIPTGIFALISHYTSAEVDTLFILALLTILGLSVHDKIVVFDRIRENLRGGDKMSFGETVGVSTSQTIVRSINITLTVIFVLVPLYLFGPETTKNFALILTIGLFFGIYSSLFFASPLLILVEEWQAKKRK